MGTKMSEFVFQSSDCWRVAVPFTNGFLVHLWICRIFDMGPTFPAVDLSTLNYYSWRFWFLVHSSSYPRLLSICRIFRHGPTFSAVDLLFLYIFGSWYTLARTPSAGHADSDRPQFKVFGCFSHAMYGGLSMDSTSFFVQLSTFFCINTWDTLDIFDNTAGHRLFVVLFDYETINWKLIKGIDFSV